MRSAKAIVWRAAILIFAAALSPLTGHENAQAELHWPAGKKEPIRVRLVALAWDHPRSTFFASEEIFLAEVQLGQDESRLVKLVYEFLPYQPRLSDSGLDYWTVHELHAMRDPSCDETVMQLTSGEVGDWRQMHSGLKYAHDAPPLNMARRRSQLPCYLTSADDYGKPVHEAPSARDRY